MSALAAIFVVTFGFTGLAYVYRKIADRVKKK